VAHLVIHDNSASVEMLISPHVQTFEALGTTEARPSMSPYPIQCEIKSTRKEREEEGVTAR
jgi:hypothetical protein